MQARKGGRQGARRWMTGGLAAAAMALTGSAGAEDIDTSLAKANQCMACHQVDARRVGPSFRVIAERYASVEGAAEYLSHSIRNGGRGRWGAITMPKQPQVSEQDAASLARWILGFAPEKDAAQGQEKP